MKYCTRCLYHQNHPLNIVFDEHGICSGCRIHEEKDLLDWDFQANKLKAILENYKNKNQNNYDCIIPVSGGRDSFFIVHTIKNTYGMNPLLVTYNKHYNTDVGVRNLAKLRMHFDCDIMTLTVNPKTVQKITRASLRKIGSIYWHCLAGQSAYPVQVAVKFKIPLIIWGAHQGIDQVGMFSHQDEVEMTRKYRKEHDLMGFEAEDLIDEFDGITMQDVVQFQYPDDKEIGQVGVRGIYLNNYIRWDSKAQHERMLSLYQYETLEQTRTFDTYNDVDCFNYSDVHDYLKLIKHGYSKVTDHVSREIRLKRITRTQGINLVNYYHQKDPENLELFLSWIGMTKNSFFYIIDQHRNKFFWKRNENWNWEYQNQDLLDLALSDESDRHDVENFNEFILTPIDYSTDPKEKYILIGKGV